jgi:hypothetical protein
VTLPIKTWTCGAAMSTFRQDSLAKRPFPFLLRRLSGYIDSFVFLWKVNNSFEDTFGEWIDRQFGSEFVRKRTREELIGSSVSVSSEEVPKLFALTRGISLFL